MKKASITLILIMLLISLKGFTQTTHLGTNAGTTPDAYNDTFLGAFSGENSTGNTNTFTGHSSGRDNTGNVNVFNGYYSGQKNTGTAGTFMGVYSGKVNTGADNTFIGAYSGQENTSGFYNVFLGKQSGTKNTTGSYNTFSGGRSGLLTTTGSKNTFIGFASSTFNTSGYGNTSLGYNSGYRNTSGYYNVSLGANSGLDNNTGHYNTNIGTFAGSKNVGGISNTMIGAAAGYTNLSGSGNVFLGYTAGREEQGSNKLYIENTNSSSPLIWGDFGTDVVNINGKLGIGDSYPLAKLVIKDGTQKLNFLANKKLTGTWPAVAENATMTLQSTGSVGGNIAFATGNSERMRINSNGDVLIKDGKFGIGVDGATYPLNVHHFPYEITSNGTNYKMISNFSNHYAYGIPENISDNGYRIGLNVSTQITDSSVLRGTLKSQYGARIQYGAHNTTSSTGVITNSYGLHLQGLENGVTTISNKYGVYQTGENFKNYFQGNVGIGTNSPIGDLHIGDNTNAGIVLNNRLNSVGSMIPAQIAWGESAMGTAGDLIIAPRTNISTASVRFFTNNGMDINERFRIHSNGNVGIGTTAPDEKLTVKGKIHTEEVRVDLTVPGPDYVFEKHFTGASKLNSNYEMPTLEEVEVFTKANHHLPEIPSAKEMQEKGIQLKEMNLKLLQKIEELTLYTIQQQKELRALNVQALEQKKTIKSQEDKNKSLESRLEKIEALLNASKE